MIVVFSIINNLRCLYNKCFFSHPELTASLRSSPGRSCSNNEKLINLQMAYQPVCVPEKVTLSLIYFSVRNGLRFAWSSPMLYSIPCANCQNYDVEILHDVGCYQIYNDHSRQRMQTDALNVYRSFLHLNVHAHLWFFHAIGDVCKFARNRCNC